MSCNVSDLRISEALQGRRVSISVTALLSLAATPTFAFMAGLTAVQGMPGMPDMPAMGGDLWTGMPMMYGLMALFHATPWLKLIEQRWRGPSDRRGDAFRDA